MTMTTFDDLESGQSPSGSQKPIFAIDLHSESEVHTWLKSTLTQLQAASWERLEKAKWNAMRYGNVQYLGQVYQPRDIPETQRRYMPQMVMPLIRDAVDEKVARIMESKPTVTVIPRDDEERDKVDAKIAKRFLSHIDYQEKMQEKLRSWLRSAEIVGESFLLARWNPDKGDALPEAKAMGRTDLKIGDVEMRIFGPELAFYEQMPSKKWDDVNYIFLIEHEYTEGLKKDYPAKAGDISSEPLETAGGVFYDWESMTERPMVGYTKKVTFYHRVTRYMPAGLMVQFCNGTMLKMGPLPEEYEGKLPPERMVLATNENQQHGESPINAVKGMASQVNNYENLIIKQLMLTSHPKWMVEEGSVNEMQLNNDTGIVRIKPGGRPPVLAQANPVSPQLMEHSQKLQEGYYRFAKSNSIVQGEPPPGVTAFVALQYVSEAESRRLSTEVSFFSEGVVSIYQKILGVCAKNYQPGQERTMMVAGKDNRFNMMKYDPATLMKNFSVIMQNSSGLPDSRAGRIQALVDTEKGWPGMVPREQVAEMIGFAQQPDKFLDIASAAARAAEAENEEMLDGKGLIEPAPWEDLIVHWKVHASPMQSLEFKQRADPESQRSMFDHLLATEMMMLEQAGKSPSFAQRLLIECPQFPMLMEPPPMLPVIGPDGMPMMPPPMGAGPTPGPMPQGPAMDATMAGAPRPQKPEKPGPVQPQN